METDIDSGTTRAATAGSASPATWRRLLTGAEDLMRWWQQELLDMVPGQWRSWATPKLRVEATPTELLVFSPPKAEPIDRVAVNAPGAMPTAAQGPMSRCELVLSSEMGLAIPVTLPDAAESNLRGVIGFSMDRYTPFNEQEVHFDVHVLRRDRKAGKLDLMLYVVPRTTLQRVTEQLAAMGLAVSTVDFFVDQSDPPLRAGVNLLPAANGRSSAVRTRFNTLLAVSAFVLLAIAMAIPVYERHQTLRELEQELAALRLPVREAEQLREDVNRRSDTLRIILERRNASPPVLDMLRELTRLTPDEAWAGQIEIKNGRLRITGEAVAGSELMQALTASGYFVDPRFEAPLTQNPRSGRERFVISLAVKESPDEP